MTNNYFRSIAGNPWFFDKNILESVQDAFDSAQKDIGHQLAVGRPVLYQPVKFAGPWDRCTLVGHRPELVIMCEHAAATDFFKRHRLGEELEAVKTSYQRVGRQPVSLTS